MVNLQAKNEKLVARARRIIAEAADVVPGDAARLFEESGHQVKLAIVMGKLQISRDEAASRLSGASGRIRLAMEG
jgi:N-acetylmuramic acid 6-phosphate etherase